MREIGCSVASRPYCLREALNERELLIGTMLVTRALVFLSVDLPSSFR